MAYPIQGNYSSSGTDGLSVPALGGEGSHSRSSLSPRIPLSPRRSSPSSYRQTPPRPPPVNVPRDFTPPSTSSSRDHPSRDGSNGYSSFQSETDRVRTDSPSSSFSSSSANKNSKKDEKKDEFEPYPSLMASTSADSQSPLTAKDFGIGPSSSSNIKREEKVILGQDENRTSPGMFARDDGADEKEIEMYPYDETETPAAVDDIPMSPIPFDREDPTTLMELPENLLTLPISPCGPHDEPAPAQ